MNSENTALRSWASLLVKVSMMLDLVKRNLIMLAVQGRAAPSRVKDQSLTEEQQRCSHPPSQQKRGGNQWASWVACKRCAARLQYHRNSRHRSGRDTSEPGSSTGLGASAAATTTSALGSALTTAPSSSTGPPQQETNVATAVGHSVVQALLPLMESLALSLAQSILDGQSRRVLVAQTPQMQGPANLLGEEDDPRTDESEVDDPRTGGDDETHRRPTMTGKGKAGNDANGDDAKGKTGNHAKGKAGNDAKGKAAIDAKGKAGIDAKGKAGNDANGKAGNDANGDDAKGNTGNRAKDKVDNDAKGKAGNEAKWKAAIDAKGKAGIDAKGKAGNDANGKAGNDAKGQGKT